MKRSNGMKKILAITAVAALMSSCGIYTRYEAATEVPDQLYGEDVLANDTTNFGRMAWRDLFTDPQLQVLISFLMNFRFIFVWIVLTIFFAMIYAYIPNVKLKFKEQLPGAMFSAIVWSVFSWGFSIYVSWEMAGSMYGSLSIIIIVMLWMYFCMYIIMVGAYLNRYFSPVNKVLVNRHR